MKLGGMYLGPALFGLAALLVPGGALANHGSAFGIVVQRCTMNENAGHTEITGVNIVYFNAHETPATEVDFLVKYYGKTYTVSDRGTFTHFARIDHNFGDPLAGRVWQGAEPQVCIPARVAFATGKILQ